MASTTSSSSSSSPDLLHHKPHLMTSNLGMEPSFPSPSSTFVPPPVAGKHEFALIRPPPGRNSKNATPVKETPDEQDDVRRVSPLKEEAGNDHSSKLIPPAIEKSVESGQIPIPILSTSRVSTPDNEFQEIPHPSSHFRDSKNLDTPLVGTPTTPHRPAPPSPAVSRRASGVPSRAGSLRRHTSTTAGSSSPVPVPPLTGPIRVAIVIRDFGFEPSDERYNGTGPFMPRANRYTRRDKGLSSISMLSQHSEDGEEGWNSFQWGMGRFTTAMANVPSTTGQNEADLNFTQEYEDDGEQFYDASEGDGDGEQDGEPEQLLPGLYRALYTFEPEGTAEMALAEDQIVRVVGRGGGVGWAVVLVPRESPRTSTLGVEGIPQQQHALVPESYLELVELDPEASSESGSEMGHTA